MSKKNFNTPFDSFLLGDNTDTKMKSNKLRLKEIRATFIVKADHHEKLKAISYWERKTLKELMDDILSQYINKYQKDKGDIATPH